MTADNTTTNTKPKKKKKKHYIDNKKFYQALVDRKNSGSSHISEYIGKCFYDIANNLSTKSNYAGYQFREDMVQIAIMQCVTYIDNFDTEKYDNPFAYFSRICTFSFYTTIDTEKTNLYVKFKSSMEALAVGEVASIQDGDDAFMDSLIGSMDVTQDYMNDFVETYEAKLKSKRAKTKLAKKAKNNGIDFK